MGFVYTVEGPIKPEELGFTTMHEHLLVDGTDLLGHVVQRYAQMIPKEVLGLKNENLSGLRNGLGTFSTECSTKNDVEYTVAELKAFRAMGGNAIVDVPFRYTTMHQLHTNKSWQ